MAHTKHDTHRYFFTSSRIYYPIRPIISLLLGISLLCLIFIPGFPLGLAIFFGVLTLSDDLIFFPFLRVINAGRNLLHKRKAIKAIVSVLSIMIGLTIGALVAYFVLINIPFVVGLTALTVSALECSIAVFLASCTIFAGLFHLFKLPTLAGAWVGSFAALLFPLIPLTADLVVGTALISGFIAALASKHLLRLFFKIKDGHSNADGYEYQLEENKEKERNAALEHDLKVAKFFNVSRDAITKLRLTLIKVIRTIKKNDSLFNEVARLRQLKSNSFKDIFHLLTTAENQQDAEKLKKLLRYADLKTFENKLDNKGISTLGLNLEMYDGEKPTESNWFEFNAPYTYLSWRIANRYGLTSYYTDPVAYFLYNLSAHVKGTVAGLGLCGKEIRKEFEDATAPLLTAKVGPANLKM